MSPLEPNFLHRPTENTPLLCTRETIYDPGTLTESSSTVTEEDESIENPLEEKKFPTKQILILCYARMMEPLAYFSIFPYIAQMVQQNGNMPTSDVGFYSGFIESISSATQALVLVFWNRLGNRIGRKSVLIYNLCGMAIGAAIFGVSGSLWQMILIRSLTGLFSGANVLVRTMIGEICPASMQAKAFSWYSFAGNIGLFFGPFIGGALVHPATQYPAIFQGIGFLEEYPFALPGFIIGLSGVIAAIFSAVLLDDAPPSAIATDPETDKSKTPSYLKLLTSKGSLPLFWTYGQVMLLAHSFWALLPISLFTPIDCGGWEFSTSQSSWYITLTGASEAWWLISVFPPLHDHMKTRGILSLCSIAYPILFSTYILVNLLLREGSEGTVVVAYVLGLLLALIGPGIWMSFTGVQLAVNEASSDPKVVGKLNCIAETITSMIKVFAPSIFNSLFAIGVRHQILWGNLGWGLMILVSLGLPIVLKRFTPSHRITVY